MGRSEPPAAAFDAATGAFLPGGRTAKASENSTSAERTANALAELRERAWHNYGAASHYLGLLQGHLEYGDDAGAIWSMKMAADYLKATERDFAPIRKSFHERVAAPEPVA